MAVGCGGTGAVTKGRALDTMRVVKVTLNSACDDSMYSSMIQPMGLDDQMREKCRPTPGERRLGNGEWCGVVQRTKPPAGR